MKLTLTTSFSMRLPLSFNQQRKTHVTEISRSALFGKLNGLAYQAIDSATAFCKMRGNPYVELAHWLHQILQMPDTDLTRIVKHFDLDLSRLARDLTVALDRLPRGSSSLQDLSSHVDEAVERGWVYGTLMFGDSRVRTGHLLVGILKTRGLRLALEGISKEFSKINLDNLTREFQKIVGGSPEETMSAADGSQLGQAASTPAEGELGAAPLGKQEALRRFSVDRIKIAREFVAELTTCRQAAAMACVSLMRNNSSRASSWAAP
jgi:type VI secretion system protein VasG